ncbi:MAG: TonB-dependent receptor plug domain-containing protein [Luteitalea sp.]|nr:TonB-dependent receptor plug domain-containing protein [Luteitalea sp.]
MCPPLVIAVFILQGAAAAPLRLDHASPAQSNRQGVGRVQLPTVVVTAQKEPADPQRVPVSLTTVSADTLTQAGMFTIGEAAIYSPNTHFSEFTARKLSNPRFRGIGASPANPSITTYFDGVPQLNSNSSSIDLLDVEQVEFVRGPQSALFGRNALGGVINVASTRPSMTGWQGGVTVPIGNYGARDVRGRFSGPLVAGRVAVGGSLGYAEREGFTRNLVTGHDLDSRSALSGKGQVLWTPTSRWEARVIVSGERARDGDYALSDLGGLRANPRVSSRDFEGFTHRDVVSTAIQTRREGVRLAFSTATGFVRWRTEDATDLDYTPLPLVTRDNREESFQFTQEVRVASPASAPVRLSDDLALRWQAGAFVFTQDYQQDAVNTVAPLLLSPFLDFPIDQHSPDSRLDDRGIGLYGQGTVVVRDRIDLSVGARVDYERKEATLNTFFTPAIAPGQLVTDEQNFANLSPQFSAAMRVTPTHTVYATIANGFKAGGFNAASPVGRESYDEERTWSFETGVKTTWADGRLSASAAAFYIDWQELQLNLPDPAVPAQFYIANVGGAASRGVELEVSARPRSGVDLFGMMGYTHARFEDGSVSAGTSLSGKEIPNTPGYTATVGAQLSRGLPAAATVYGRAEVALQGAFQYDDANTAGQGAYSLASFRAGARRGGLFAEVWVKNAFETRYIPVAFAYDNFAPSGFVGESGAPRTLGVSIGASF